MTDLASWLLAQIADDEAAARAVAWGQHWKFSPQRILEVPPAVTTDDGRSLLGGAESAAQHAARHDPARVLAECAAKRAIVELHKSWPVLVETPPEFTSDTADLNSISFSMSQRIMWMTNQEYRERFGDEPPTAPVIRLLAQPFADRPGFDPAWRIVP